MFKNSLKHLPWLAYYGFAIFCAYTLLTTIPEMWSVIDPVLENIRRFILVFVLSFWILLPVFAYKRTIKNDELDEYIAIPLSLLITVPASFAFGYYLFDDYSGYGAYIDGLIASSFIITYTSLRTSVDLLHDKIKAKR